MSTMMMLMMMVVVVLTIVKTMVVIIIMSAMTMVNFTYALYTGSSNLSFWTKFYSVAIEINASFHMVRFVFNHFTKLESIL